MRGRRKSKKRKQTSADQLSTQTLTSSKSLIAKKRAKLNSIKKRAKLNTIKKNNQTKSKQRPADNIKQNAQRSSQQQSENNKS